MNSKHASFRVPGQRSIRSTFLFCASNPNRSGDSEGDVKIKTPNRGVSVSLSEFLNRKLHRSGVLPNSLQGKERLISSPVGNGDVIESDDGKNDRKKRVEAEEFVHDVVLEQFKCTSTDEKVGSSSTNDMHESRKRKNPHKTLIVLGDDPIPPHPIPKREKKEQGAIANKKPRNLFNHYGNGSGWWDCNMEGVDNEEVGCNEMWEGLGSATLGGLEWH